MTGSWGEELSR